MKLIQNRKVVVIAAIMAFLLSGIAFICIGYRTMPESFAPLEGSEVLLSPGDVAAQRILGNDMRLRSMDIIMEDVNASEEASLDVTLMEGGWDEETGVVKEKMTYNASDLSKGSRLHLDFAKTKLLYNRDYFVVFRLEDRVDGAFICMEGSDEGQGLYVNGVNYGIALAHNREFSTCQSQILFLWKLIFVFGGISIFLCMWKNINFAEAMGTVAISVLLWEYVWGVIDCLKLGYYLLFGVALLAVIFIVIWIVGQPKESMCQIWKEQIRWGVLCFLLIVGFYFLSDSGNCLKYWDELDLWGMETQMMYMFDKFPFHAKSQVRLLRYPPLSPIFQYLFLEFYGKVSESVMLFAKHFLETSIFLGCFSTVFHKVRSKKSFGCMEVLLCIGLPQLLFGTVIPYTLWVDTIVGLLFGYLTVKYWTFIKNGSRYDVIMVAMTAIALVLVKENGLILVLTMLATVISTEILSGIFDHGKNGGDVRRKTKAAALIAISSFVGESSWQLYINTHIKYLNHSGEISVTPDRVSITANVGSKNRILNYFSGKGAEYQYQMIPTHLKKILLDDYYDANIVHLSFGVYLTILILLLIGIGIMLYKDKTYFKGCISFVSGTAIFTVMAFHMLYTFVFSESEAVKFADESRYLGNYLLGITIYVIYIALNFQREHFLIEKLFIGLVCIMLILATDTCSALRNRVLVPQEEAEWRKQAIALRQKITENDKVFWISKSTDGKNYSSFKYYLAPATISSSVGTGSNVITYPSLEAEEDREYQINVDQFKQKLLNYNYLYIDQCDSSFKKEFGILFENPQEIGNSVLYKIIPENEKLLKRETYN